MPLTEVVRVLNRIEPPPVPGLHPTTPFVFSAGQAMLHYTGLRLISRFQPFADRQGQVCGHMASLAAAGPGQGLKLGARAVFSLPANPGEVAGLDSLVRTLHALNYLMHPHPCPGQLILKVQQGTAAGLSLQRGLAYQDFLAASGLLPRHLALEIHPEDDVRQEDLTAVRARGYRIAVGGVRPDQADTDLLRRLRPDMVRLDTLLPNSSQGLPELVDRLHQLGTEVMVEAGNGESPRPRDAVADIDYVLRRPDFPAADEQFAAADPGQVTEAPRLPYPWNLPDQRRRMFGG